MTHPLKLQFWAGWPALIVAAYAVIGWLGTPEMALGARLFGALGGGVLLVLIYWTLWRAVGWFDPRGVR